ncbi:MAG: glycosyl hydrolase family 8 [Pseudomonadota bacterium]|jgi:endoglucanase
MQRWLVLLIVLLSPLAGQASALPGADWERYKTTFIAPEGRVIDTANQGVSHSEGQGYGMLLALAAGDRATFERLWQWTQKNLRREDGLFAWQWRPNDTPPVKDWNNATDGDLLIAWALAEAGETWKQPEWTEAARTIAMRIRTTLIRPSNLGPLLLPAQQGFEAGDHLQLNPAYWVYPAFRTLTRIDPDPVWKDLSSSGLKLLELTRYGAAGIPPDWVRLYNDGRLGLSDKPLQRRFAFEAIRVPLYLCWIGQRDPLLLEAFQRAWPSDGAPAWLDLANGERAAYPLTLAQRAMRQLVLACAGKQARPLLELQTDDYYGATLTLLARLALTAPRTP